MWQRLLLTQITPIKLRESEDFDEFHAPYRSDWSQLVYINAYFIVTSDAINKQRRGSVADENLDRALISTRTKT